MTYVFTKVGDFVLEDMYHGITLRVKTVPSEEDSASCEVLAGLIQSLFAVSSANYAFSSKPSLRQPSKMKVVKKENSVTSLLQDMTQVSSSRANSAIKKANYRIICTIMAIISREHKHGCLFKRTDSFPAITALGGDSLMKAPDRTKFQAVFAKIESFLMAILVASCYCLVLWVCVLPFFALGLVNSSGRSLCKCRLPISATLSFQYWRL